MRNQLFPMVGLLHRDPLPATKAKETEGADKEAWLMTRFRASWIVLLFLYDIYVDYLHKPLMKIFQGYGVLLFFYNVIWFIALSMGSRSAPLDLILFDWPRRLLEKLWA